MRVINSGLLRLLLFLFAIPILKAQNDFSELKAEILEATSEFKKLEGIIYLGSAYNRAQIDSIYFYVDSLSYPNIETKKIANENIQPFKHVLHQKQ